MFSTFFLQEYPSTGQIVSGGLILFGTAFVYLALRTPAARARRAGAQLPPGPRRAFLIGNLFNFPRKRWYETFTKWRDEFGA